MMHRTALNRPASVSPNKHGSYMIRCDRDCGATLWLLIVLWLTVCRPVWTAAHCLYCPPCPKRTRRILRSYVVKRRRELWLQRLNLTDVPAHVKFVRVCEEHFSSGEPADTNDSSNVDWAPSLHLQIMPCTSASAKKKAERTEARAAMQAERMGRREERERVTQEGVALVTQQLQKCHREMEAETLAKELVIAEGAVEGSHEEDWDAEQGSVWRDDVDPAHSIGIQTDITMDMLKMVFEEVTNLRTLLEEQIPGEKWLEGNDKKTLFYTGLPKVSVLKCVFNLVSPYLKRSNTEPGKWKSFLMSLMILRLNLSFTDIGYRFNVDRRTASRHFGECLSVMYVRLKCLVFWPQRKVMKETMPRCFRANFGDKVTIIIDCFEVFWQTPGSSLGRAQLWSNYKHHSTIKVLIGITPQGTVAFISDAFGGRASDRFITEKCGLLDGLRPGDMVLADRGFDIETSVSLRGASLRIPTFTEGYKQLSPFSVEYTRGVANVRIHVERVIGVLRQKYNILQGSIPVAALGQGGFHMKKQINMMLTVCSLLVNLCPAVVPLF